MIVGPNGQPMVSAGPTGRELSIQEAIINGKKSWGVDIKGEIDALEAAQILADTARAILQQQRSIIAERKLNAKVAEQIKQMGNEDESR